MLASRLGLGATQNSTEFVTDRVFFGGDPLAAPINVTVVGAAATVLFADLTSPGLYLLDGKRPFR